MDAPFTSFPLCHKLKPDRRRENLIKFVTPTVHSRGVSNIKVRTTDILIFCQKWKLSFIGDANDFVTTARQKRFADSSQECVAVKSNNALPTFEI